VEQGFVEPIFAEGSVRGMSGYGICCESLQIHQQSVSTQSGVPDFGLNLQVATASVFKAGGFVRLPSTATNDTASGTSRKAESEKSRLLGQAELIASRGRRFSLFPHFFLATFRSPYNHRHSPQGGTRMVYPVSDPAYPFHSLAE
jgi:hypothetical protein